MSFGGGSFVTQNKVLPGIYVNVAAENKVTSELSDRGVAAMGVELNWGPDNELMYMTESEFRKNCKTMFGCEYTAEEMKGLRDLFKHAAACYLYRLNSGSKASNSLCEAKYSGTLGNNLLVVVSMSNSGYWVQTYLNHQEVDAQLVADASELQDNDYVCWKKGATLTMSSGLALTGGSNKAVITLEDYQNMLIALESVRFNILGCVSQDLIVKELFVLFTQAQRMESGAKFQTVLYDCDADYEGIISVANPVYDDLHPESSLVYWVTGAEAGCAVNGTLTNALYDGEFEVEPVMGDMALREALADGELVLHKMGDQMRVLEDVNSLVNCAEGQTEDMKYNQTMRVLDQIVLDLSALFYDKYLGVVMNDNAGRMSLWNDIVSYYRKLEALRAIEGFDAADITVSQGESKKAVVVNSYLTVINSMSQLYLTVTFE